MNPFEAVITHCRHLEHLLESRLGAQGRGLHEKTTSVQDRLSSRLVGKLRFIASARNRLVHEHSNRGPVDLDDYIRACNWAAQEIEQLSQAAAPQPTWSAPTLNFEEPRRRGCGCWWWAFLLIVLLNYRGCNPEPKPAAPSPVQPSP